ncbi:MAG: hypothetical protein ICV83_13535, partial [Cytophagales bacterium]|nr:hypothetical protein [Cytophagales bacterium]
MLPGADLVPLPPATFTYLYNLTTQMPQDIAIIGMAGQFPDARNLDELYRNLCEGRDSVRPISAERIRKTTLEPGRPCLVCGYLEEIDVFDHRFFNISYGEAQTMDPHQRLLLQTAYETFENAGYPADALKGSNTAVFVADASLDYYQHADAFVPTLATGNTKAFLAAMLCRHFDLRGNALLVDTTCSASLLALHLACNELRLGDADLALACGVNLYLFPYRGSAGLELDAPDGKSKAFSAQANGMSHGEAVACVLLKPLEKALADGDIIHAVIKGSAVNSNAARSASMTAPDSRAQAEVIGRAWQKAGINPRQLGFIEAHGSGTELGDNIEIGGFTLAFNAYTGDKQFCPVSTIKSNIGHTRAAAGIVGLLKAVLSLKHGVLFPAVHFREPHPHIRFDASAVYVNERLRPWESPGGPRYAGVSSIGLSGTNCHVVLAEAPPAGRPAPRPQGGYHLLTVSAKSPDSLRRNVAALSEGIRSRSDEELADIACTLGTGRKHYPWRRAVVAATVGEARQKLEALLPGIPRPGGEAPADAPKLIFVFDGGEEPFPVPPGSLAARFDAFRQHLAECTREAGTDPGSFALQYCFYRLLESRGIVSDQVLATETGRIAAQVLAGTIPLGEGIRQSAARPAGPVERLGERVAKLIARETAERPVAFVHMGGSGAWAWEIRRQAEAHPRCAFVALADAPGSCPFLEMVRSLYLLNCPLPWPQLLGPAGGRRVELPTYQFEKTRCWLREEPRRTATLPAPGDATGNPPAGGALRGEGSPTHRVVARLWAEVLGGGPYGLTDDFFAVGGDSLKATRVINRLNGAFGVRLAFEDLFDFPTLDGLAGCVDEACGTEQKLYQFWRDVLKQDDIGPDDNFFELGGHSLIANQIINRIRDAFNLPIHFDDFFTYPTIRAMAACLDAKAQAAARPQPPAIVPLPPQPHYEASHAQKRLWVLSQSPEGARAYNQPGVYEVDWEVDVPRLEKAFRALVARHESLRTTFALVEDRLVQRVHEPEAGRFALEYYDFRDREGAREAALQLARRQAGALFDLEKGPLLKALMIRTGPRQYVLLLNLHHIITDGWSNGVLVNDLLTLYQAFRAGAPSPLPPLRIQYRDYAAWHNGLVRSEAFGAHRHYWLRQFADPAPALELPTDFPRPAAKLYRGSIVEFTLDAALTGQLRDCCQRHGVTLFMGLMGCLYALLYRLSGQKDITIGTPVAGRDHQDLEDQIGFYANTLALRTRFEGTDTFGGLLEKVKARTLDAFAHGAYPFDLLVDELPLSRDWGRSPLFDVMLTLQNMHNRRALGSFPEGLSVRSHETDNLVSKFDLVFCFSEAGDHLDVLLEYDTALFTEKTIRSLTDSLVALMAQALPQPGLPLRELRGGGPAAGESAQSDS